MVSPLRRAATATAAAFLGSGLTIMTAAPATAGCAYETGWQVTTRADVWMLTNVYSYWLSGPGSITYSQSATATRGTQKDASISISAGAVIARAEAKFGMNWSESTSRSASWSYNISVPSGQTARAAVYKRGSRFGVRRWAVNGNCTVSYSPTYYQFSPFASVDNSSYCIGKDPYPGTRYVFTSGCGH